MATETFALQSLPGSAWALGIGIGVVTGGLGAFFTWLAFGLRKMRFEIESDAIRVQAPFYGRRLAKSALKLDQAKVVDIQDKSYRRSNGVGMPGYKVGWFKNEAGEKSLLYVTNRAKVLSIPTTEGYTLLLSADDPTAVLAALKGA
jgi:hypothetical protein